MLNVLFAMLTLINHILVVKVILTFIKQIVHVNYFLSLITLQCGRLVSDSLVCNNASSSYRTLQK